ncbi:MmgE/PrpD family protein [Streptomyces sp. NPDC050560]|uniref:MmgE/PrpD family protein n=1 Tax=Streptomyces sp. NPDC050560 TaxID=3365630 RepID=UPI0037A48C14
MPQGTTSRSAAYAFSRRLLDAHAAPLPPAVASAARRSLYNVLGTAVGAARTPAVDAALATARELGAAGGVAVPGRRETVDAHWGAVIAGTAAHFDDFDDTHLATVIHPGAATMATVLALWPEIDAPGARYLSAFALGCETQLRIGNAVSPSHYDRGWHITGTCGVFGAAAAAALLLGLDAGATEAALALAGDMVLGHREAFGSMTKPFHPGKAAANGLLAARLAAAGIGAPHDPLGERGVLPVFSDALDGHWLTDGFDGPWELEKNAFKPYPCGIVAHPGIDAAVAASPQVGDPEAITAVELVCHPLVPELMGREQPADGLQARFSARHAVAVGLLDGQVGLPQFADGRAVAPDAVRLRSLTTLRPSEDCARDAATITVERRGAEPVTVHIPHARGSLERPLTDDELHAKVRGLVAPVLGPDAADTLRRAVDALADAADPAELVAAVRPGDTAPPAHTPAPAERADTKEGRR